VYYHSLSTRRGNTSTANDSHPRGWFFSLVHSVIGPPAVASSSRFPLGDFVSLFSRWGGWSPHNFGSKGIEMKRLILCVAAVLFIGVSQALAAPIQWTVAAGGNDHWYEAVLADAPVSVGGPLLVDGMWLTGYSGGTTWTSSTRRRPRIGSCLHHHLDNRHIQTSRAAHPLSLADPEIVASVSWPPPASLLACASGWYGLPWRIA
jgi:hypothetical protein